MKVLLVYPEFPDTFWSFKHALKFIRKKASSPPLGLLTVAAMLPPTWEAHLADLNVEPLSPKDLEWADAAFVSAMVIQRDSARRAIATCKQAGLMVVAGGPLFTAEYADFPDVDNFVLNEAEITLPDFLSDLETGQAKRVYKTDQFPDLHQTPAPRWELVNFKNYATMDLQFSRGCPYNCEFCNITVLFGRRPRTKSAAQLIGELDGLYKLGWRGGIFFVDDNFIGNKKLLKREILPALIDWRQGKSGLSFSTEVSINLADDDELVEMMAKAGFTTVFIGIETPDENGLAECNKYQNTGRDLVASVKRLQRAGIQVQGGFIVGFDSDKPSIFQRQIDFIQQSGIVSAMVGLLQAPYGTPLYSRLKAEGRILSQLSGDNVDGSTNIIPKMDIRVLRDGYVRLLEHIYAPAFFYERVITFLKEYKSPKIRVHFEMDYLYAFWRSIYVLGIKGVERAQFWKLWAWVLVHRPKLFPQAITLAIYGYHFRQICLLGAQRNQPAS
jgi:radical SAM superfamily enzyme YgiQ (UPF0313 family)